jgi:hypothetical protein
MLGTYLAMSGLRPPALFLIGVLLGMTLYRSAFGFTTAYRRLLLYRDAAGVQAQLLMLAVATVLFAPVLATGSVFGQPVAGAVAPAGVQVAAGAFLFGVGMQLAGGCGSGTLYTVGGGSPRMAATLVAFCAGSFWGSLDMDRWQRLPSWDMGSLGETLGWTEAVLLQLGLIGLIALGLARWRSRGAGSAPLPSARGWRRAPAGPWSLATGAILLALLNFLTLLIAGHPWTITWAFGLWGAKGAVALGWDPATSPFWSGDFQRSALEASVLSDVTSIMDVGIVIGAFCAAALAGRMAPRLRIPPLSLLAAVLGGMAMGYGARIAYGCNVGAFFSGVASASLHGWLWIAAALPGTWVGVKLRPWFSLRN